MRCLPLRAVVVQVTRLRSVALFALVTVAPCFPAQAFATPTVSVHWGGCPFPTPDPTNRDAGTGPTETITVTVNGLSGPVRGAQVWLLFSSQGSLPDAWRYDPGGCEAGRLTMGPGIRIGSCPPLDGANPLEVSKFEYDPQTGNGRLVYARTYEGFVADPNVTYTLGRFTFDHSAPDPCSCLEVPLCIHIINATWVDGNIIEYSFAIAREYLNWNDPVNSVHCPFPHGDLATVGTCIPTPAASSSWGRVKVSYR